MSTFTETFNNAERTGVDVVVEVQEEVQVAARGRVTEPLRPTRAFRCSGENRRSSYLLT